MKLKLLTLLAVLLAITACSNNEEQPQEENKQEVNVYTHRHYDTDKLLFEQFEKETGIKVNVLNANADELITRLENEGENSPADVLITVDAGRLGKAKDMGLLQSVESEALTNQVPEHLKDSDNQWYGLTKRARLIAYDKDRVNPDEVKTYWDLTNDKYKGKVLVRSSSNIYNQSLLASMIALNPDSNYAEQWAEGIVKNMARNPAGGDRDQVKAVAAGLGDMAIVNSYYIGKMIESDDESDRKAVANIGLIFPNQNGRGTHINVSGAGVAKYSKNKDNAIKFIEFLTSEKAQDLFSKSNYEYPVNPNVAASELLQSWGSFQEDKMNLSNLGEYNSDAVMLFNKVGWN